MSNIDVYYGKEKDRLVNFLLHNRSLAPIHLTLINASNTAKVCVVFLERKVMEPIELERTFIEAKGEKVIEIKSAGSAEIRKEDLSMVRIALISLRSEIDMAQTDQANTPACHASIYQVSKLITPIPDRYRLIDTEDFPSSALRMEEGYSSMESVLTDRCPKSAALTDMQNKWTLGFHSNTVDFPTTSLRQASILREEAITIKAANYNSETRKSKECSHNSSNLSVSPARENLKEQCSEALRTTATACHENQQFAEKMPDVFEDTRQTSVGILDFVQSHLSNLAILAVCYVIAKAAISRFM
uniref:MSP domain-containing protein n=1 Tax=Trichuris muris TaxID=70415 RepID=A0A5S6QPK3_TRIMR